jgi:uncharacterized protein (DUF3084 family)
MNVTSPQNDVPLPADIEQAYNKAKNAITLAEAEVARLRDLRVSEETTIVELNKQISWGKQQLQEVNDAVTKKQKELVALISQANDLASQVLSLKSEKETLTISLNDRESAVVSREKDVQDKAVSLALKEASLNERTVSVEDRESNVTERENKLKDFVAKI